MFGAGLLWPLVGLAALMASEVILRLPFARVLRQIMRFGRRAGQVLASKRVSDHWKERALPAYAWRIGSGSVVFLGMLIAVAAPVLGLGLVYPDGMALWLSALATPMAILVLCVVSIAYLWLRTRG